MILLARRPLGHLVFRHHSVKGGTCVRKCVGVKVNEGTQVHNV